MSRTIILSFLLVMVLLGVLGYAALTAEDSTVGAEAPTEPRPPDATAGTSAPPDPARRVALQDATVDPAASVLPDSKRIRIKGMCYDCRFDDPNAPAAGVTLHLKVALEKFYDHHRSYFAAQTWKPPAPVVTAADGTFVFECRVPLRVWPLCFTADLPLAAQGDFDFYPGDEAERVVNGVPEFEAEPVFVTPGHPVGGSLVNHRGEPVGHAVLLFKYPVYQRGKHIRRADTFAIVKDGRFDCGSVSPGPLKVTVADDMGEILGTDLIVVGPEHDNTDLEFVLHETPRVEGLVLDPRTDQPVPHFPIHLDFNNETNVRRYTDARGRFRIHADSFLDDHVRFHSIYVPDEPRPRLDGPRGWIRMPARDVVLRLTPWPEFQIRAVHSDGAPATNLRVLSSGPDEVRQIGAAKDGVTRWIGLPPGPVRIRVASMAPRIEMSPIFELDAEKWTETPLTIKFEKSKTLAVHVHGLEQVEDRPTARLADPTCWDLAIGEADDQGTIRLVVPPKFRGYFLRVSAGSSRVDHELTLENERKERVDVRFKISAPESRGSETVEIELETGGAELNRERLRHLLVLEHKGSGRRWQLDSDGRARVPPGSYNVVTRATGQGWSTIGERQVPTIPKRVVASVDVHAKTSKVPVVVPELEPCTVTGTVRHDGELLPNARLWFGSTNRLWVIHARSDAQGRFVAKGMPPGSYLVRAVGQLRPGWTSTRDLWFAGTVTAAPGPATRVALDTERKKLRLRVLFADSTPVRDMVVDVSGYGAARTDGAGRLDILPIPPVPIRLQRVSLPDRRLRQAIIKPPFRDRVIDVLLK